MITAFAVLASLAFVATAYAQSMKAGVHVQSVVQRVESVTFRKTIHVSGGPGGPRDYVGLWRVATMKDGSPEELRSTRIGWKYLDDRNDAAAAAERKIATSGPTEGTITFDNLTPGEYQARFYKAASTAPADLLAVPLQFTLVASVELLYHGEGVRVDVNRVPGVLGDVVTVVYSDGRTVKTHLDRDVMFSAVKVGEPAVSEAAKPADAP